MNSLPGSALKIARVSVDVRLYFDVPVESASEVKIVRAALSELREAEDAEQIQIGQLAGHAVFPMKELHRLKAKDVTICDVREAQVK